MYDEEKNLYFHSLAGASKLADQERVAIELTNPKESDNPSDDIENLAMKSREQRRFWKHLKPKPRDLREN